ncbi:alpha/beta hydrolase, partial [Acinetobacter baumannii]
MGTGVASILNTISKGIKRIVFIDGMGAPFTVSAEDVVQHLKTSLRLSEIAHLTKLNGFSEKNQPQFSSMEVAVKTR